MPVTTGTNLRQGGLILWLCADLYEDGCTPLTATAAVGSLQCLCISVTSESAGMKIRGNDILWKTLRHTEGSESRQYIYCDLVPRAVEVMSSLMSYVNPSVGPT